METIPYQEDEMDSDDEETANPLDRPTFDLTVPLPYDRDTPLPDDGTPAATEALFRVAQDALTEFFATLPKNLRGGAAVIAEEETTEPTQSEPPTALPISEPATTKLVPIAPLQASPTIAALSMLAHGNPPLPIPTEGQTQTSPDSASRTPLRLVITSDSEGEYDDNSEVSDTAKDEDAALDGALLEEDDNDYRFEDDANSTGTATLEAEDPYDIPGPGYATVVTTPIGPTNMNISPSQK